MGNHRRAAGRRAALRDRLVLLDAAARPASDAGILAGERMEALESLARLPEDLREAVLLTSWDGLSADEAATALGIRPGTFRVRLHRARKALDQRDRAERSVPVAPLNAASPVTRGGTR
jgi:RNA polymerase sigma-70 factor (ECF subfamily)